MSEIKLSNIRPSNLVINGAMTFWQRGNISTAVNKYWCDRWFATNSYTGGTVVQERIEDASSIRSKYCAEMKQTVAAGVVTELSFKQIFEKQFVRPFINKKVILSFYIKSNRPILYTKFSPLDGFTGGTDVSREIKINVADTWEKKSFVFDMSSYVEAVGNEEDAGAVLNIGFGSTALGLGQTNLNVNDYFRISEVMVTEGSEETDFVMSGKNIVDELVYCQRYFEGSIIGTLANIIMAQQRSDAEWVRTGTVFFKTQKRIVPVCSAILSNGQTTGQILPTVNAMSVDGSISPTSLSARINIWTSDAEL